MVSNMDSKTNIATYLPVNQGGTLQQLRNEVDEVKTILVENVEELQKRDTQLTSLEESSEYLTANAQLFVKTCGKIRQQKRRRNLKLMAAIGMVFVVTITIIVVVIYYRPTVA